MATKTIQICDVCDANASTAATLILNGASTEVDLCARHAKELTVAVRPFVTVGRTIERPRPVAKKAAAAAKKTTAKKTTAKKGAKKTGATKAGTRRRTAASSQVAEIRAWGYANGFNVASKGRLKPDLVAAFEAADK